MCIQEYLTTGCARLQGCSRQRAEALVNAVALYVTKVPLALLLAFRQGMGPQGCTSTWRWGPPYRRCARGIRLLLLAY